MSKNNNISNNKENQGVNYTNLKSQQYLQQQQMANNPPQVYTPPSHNFQAPPVMYTPQSHNLQAPPPGYTPPSLEYLRNEQMQNQEESEYYAPQATNIISSAPPITNFDIQTQQQINYQQLPQYQSPPQQIHQYQGYQSQQYQNIPQTHDIVTQGTNINASAPVNNNTSQQNYVHQAPDYKTATEQKTNTYTYHPDNFVSAHTGEVTHIKTSPQKQPPQYQNNIPVIPQNQHQTMNIPTFNIDYTQPPPLTAQEQAIKNRFTPPPPPSYNASLNQVPIINNQPQSTQSRFAHTSGFAQDANINQNNNNISSSQNDKTKKEETQPRDIETEMQKKKTFGFF